MMLLLAACTGGSKQAELLEKIPADVELVAVGNAKYIIESAGGTIEGSKITLPSYITDNLSKRELREFEDLMDMVENNGINIEACAVAMPDVNGEPIIIFNVIDAEKFKKAIEDEDFDEKDSEDGVVYYKKQTYDSEYNDDYDSYSYIAIEDAYVYLVEEVRNYKDFKPIREIKKMIADAKENSFAGTAFGNYITDGNTAGLAVRIPREAKRELREEGLPRDFIEMVDGVICFTGDLTGNTAKVGMKFFDEDGQDKSIDYFAKYMNLDAKISSKALSYMGENESLIYAVAIEDVDWDEYMDIVADAANLRGSERSAMTLTKTYLEKFNGTVAFGVGLTHGLKSVKELYREENIMDEIAMTMVCETKEGEAKKLLKDTKSLLDGAGIDYDDTSDGINITIPGGMGNLYAKITDDIIVISNHRISDSNDNATVDKVNFTDFTGAIGLVIDKNHKIMQDLELNNSVQADFGFNALKMEATMTLTVEGDGSEGLIETVAKTVLELAKDEEKLKKFMPGRYDEYSQPDYGSTEPPADSLMVDSVASW